jgi:2-polyprenyl-6-methoxyphenol hydroxylase-like FAD-dependent oxidoreductase
MRITIIGGGPAGLYFAILMKKAEPAHQITIYERNGPDDTFGWGVVFSGKTLANLRAADAESHCHYERCRGFPPRGPPSGHLRALASHFAEWPQIVWRTARGAPARP